MGEIEHKYELVNGLKIHYAEIGSGSSPVAVFLHGFPEIWYSWRHQMIGLSKAGFRAVAPDYRGYGLSNQPPESNKATHADFISDISALLDALSIPKVFLIGKDFGARIAYFLALLHPEKVIGIVTLGVPFVPPGPPAFIQHLPEGFYVSRWMEPGRAEADFGRLNCKTVTRNIYILFSRSEIPIAKENQEIMDMVDSSTPLPPWFSEEDLEVYGSLYENSGFETALQVPYRAMNEEFNMANMNVEVPALLIMGTKDYVLKLPGMEDYIENGHAKMFVPKLETTYLPGGSHFVQEQFPDQVNQLILKFLTDHS